MTRSSLDCGPILTTSIPSHPIPCHAMRCDDIHPTLPTAPRRSATQDAACLRIAACLGAFLYLGRLLCRLLCRAQACGSGSSGHGRFHGRPEEHPIACTASNQIESAVDQGFSCSCLHALPTPADAAHVGLFLARLTPIRLSPPPPACLHRPALGASPSVSLPKLVLCLATRPHHHRLASTTSRGRATAAPALHRRSSRALDAEPARGPLPGRT